MTDHDETWVMARFQELYGAFPKAVVEKRDPDWPDFVLTFDSGKTIGVELTGVINDVGLHRQYETRNEITDLVLNELKWLLPFNFSLEIDLLPIGVKKSKKKKVVQELVEICATEAQHLRNKRHIKLYSFKTDLNSLDEDKRFLITTNGYRNLPDGIRSIEVFRFDLAPEPWNPRAGGLTVPNFGEEHLQHILSKKEPKITSYSKCDEYWLLIWEGRLPSGYFKQIEIDLPVNSVFDSVFLLRTTNQEVVVLKD